MEKLNRSAARTEQTSTVVSFSEDITEDLKQRFPDAFQSDPPKLKGAIVSQWVRHTGTGCRCQHGILHGPYHYLMERLPDRRLRKRYIRKSDLHHVRALVLCHQNARAQSLADRREWADTYSQIKRNLRETDRMMSDYLRGNP